MSRKRGVASLSWSRYSVFMDSGSAAKFALYRFVWIQDFAVRLAELGTPASDEALIALGAERFDNGPEQDAGTAAESVWSEWPTVS